jgi:hypothetical protein
MPGRYKNSRKNIKHGGESIQRNTNTFRVYIGLRLKEVNITVGKTWLQSIYNIDKSVYGLGQFNGSTKVYYRLPAFFFENKKVIYRGKNFNQKKNIITLEPIPVTDKNILEKLNAYEIKADADGALFDGTVTGFLDIIGKTGGKNNKNKTKKKKNKEVMNIY